MLFLSHWCPWQHHDHSYYIILPLKTKTKNFQQCRRHPGTDRTEPILTPLLLWPGGIFKINTGWWRIPVCVQICILPFSVCRKKIQSICLSTFLEGCQNCIDRDGENWVTSAHIVQSAHILLIQFWEIALAQKNKKIKKTPVIILSLSVRGDIYSKYPQWLEKRDQKKPNHRFIKGKVMENLSVK